MSANVVTLAVSGISMMGLAIGVGMAGRKGHAVVYSILAAWMLGMAMLCVLTPLRK